ncbi:ammonium transporter, Amt family [Granulicella rosea]|uniref:Ammonium transporter, Amt family n=1 Tax=Granulicella rosea TaxID=474952 RepID=A0A239EHA1_9BACT|nr:sensor domain-containing diguanylate cyclase [Granulicella rosea]SNS43811.1 ammonium transporter, Amt family [Granulicella rosea]
MEQQSQAIAVDETAFDLVRSDELPDEISGFGLMFDLLPCMAFAERDGQIVAWNTLAKRMLSLSGARPVTLEDLFAEPVELPADGARERFEGALMRRNGPPLPVNCAVKAAALDGRRCRLILAMEDPAARDHAAENEGRLLKELLEAAPEAAVIVNGTRVRYVNRHFVELFGYSAAGCAGQDLADLLIPDGLRHEIEVIEHQLLVEGRASIESSRQASSGELIDVSVMVSPVRLGGETRALLVTYRDIREQKRQEERLRFTALHDVLTGLANRALFLDRLELTMSRMRRRPDRNFSIFFIDLDGFKLVNDTYGHASGDALLLVIAERLRRCLRPQDTIARFGGDEFALLLDEIDDAGGIATVGAVAERIQCEIGMPIPLASLAGDRAVEAQVTASIGIIVGDLHYRSAEEMMRDADRAMYDAKTAGKARHTIFTAHTVS